jgi:hypothetical protein
LSVNNIKENEIITKLMKIESFGRISKSLFEKRSKIIKLNKAEVIFKFIA